MSGHSIRLALGGMVPLPDASRSQRIQNYRVLGWDSWGFGSGLLKVGFSDESALVGDGLENELAIGLNVKSNGYSIV